MNIRADIKIIYEVNGNTLKQIITITPERKKYLKYFIYNKFVGARELEEKLANFYAGDGDIIFFKEERRVGNKIVLLYSKKKNADIHFDNIEFSVWAPIPKTEGCDDCKFYAETERYNICKLREKMNFRKRNKCLLFEQKEFNNE